VLVSDETPREVEKPWGSELWWAHTDRYAGKILRVNAGHKLSVQYHDEKDETSYVLSGRLVLEQGDSVERMHRRTVGPGTAWRNEALEDCVIVEVSAPELHDVVRVEDRYGRARQDTRGAER
jgi:mannose-6-phosphate isomerase